MLKAHNRELASTKRFILLYARFERAQVRKIYLQSVRFRQCGPIAPIPSARHERIHVHCLRLTSYSGFLFLLELLR